MNPVEILLKEYETLRQEVLNTMNNRVSILSFGLATIGAIFAASLAIYATSNNVVLPSLTLSLAVPFICNFVLFMWLGEYQRMQRAGKFLADLEKRINDEVSRQLLTWETLLRSQHQHMTYPYNTTVMLLLAISMISYCIGIINSQLTAGIILALAIVGIGIHFATYIYAVRRISKLHA
jgi:hypothetical protein